MERSEQDLAVWRRLAPGGLLLVGAGASVVADAATRRARRAVRGTVPGTASGTGRSGPTAWAAEGTLGLTLLGAGLSLFGEAVKRRALHDVAERARHDPRHDTER